ncbi:MHC class I polypeptide-related sequence B-like [Cynocephalus volans]|uniref:MHC class I polypeptide-related sequence B-like n=1 Tax=Cynocephalus volans TaxID=110931 RepID=UPI002FC96D22
MVASQDARFVAEGRLDGQLFLHYDSERGRAEPQGPLTEAVLGAETWETETKDLTEIGKELRVTLAQIIALQGQKGVSHSLQEERGCEISGGSSAMGFRHFYYDGEPFLSYNPKTWTWTVAQSSAQTLAVEVKKSWDTDGIQSKDYWARVHGELCRRLQRYLDSWVDLKERAVSPAVNVTPSKALEGRVTLSDVNGTYQSWVTTKIPQEEEQRFTGHVGHSGSHSTPPVPSGKASVLEKIWPAMVVVAAVAAAVAAAVIIYVCLCKKKTMSAAQGPAL